MVISRINLQEVRLSLTLFIISSLPVVISGTGESSVDKVSSLQINNHVSIGANDTVSDNNQNITSTSHHDYEDDRIPKEVDHFFLTSICSLNPLILTQETPILNFKLSFV